MPDNFTHQGRASGWERVKIVKIERVTIVTRGKEVNSIPYMYSIYIYIYQNNNIFSFYLLATVLTIFVSKPPWCPPCVMSSAWSVLPLAINVAAWSLCDFKYLSYKTVFTFFFVTCWTPKFGKLKKTNCSFYNEYATGKKKGRKKGG